MVLCYLNDSLSLWLTSDWQEKFEFWGELVFCVKSIGEINSSNSAVGVNLHSQCFNIVSSISSSCEIRQVELNLIPALIESHGHCANERLYSGCWLIVWCSESTSNVLVIKYLHFESEIFLQLYIKITIIRWACSELRNGFCLYLRFW